MMIRIWGWFWRLIAYFLLLMVFLFGMPSSTYHLNSQLGRISLILNDVQFDYVTWEVNAIGAKIKQTLWGEHPFMTETDRSQYVRDYMADLAQVLPIERQIEAMYADPNINDPDAESADLRAQRDSMRDDLRSRQSLIEAILEGQVASVLLDEGFGSFGQLLPPIAMRFTQVPNLLIVSPRDTIRFDVSINIDPLPVDEMVEIEDRVYEELGLSPLIVPLGGIALYPAMIAETANLRWAVETFAHEWIHHYFFFFPLGLGYFSGDGFSGETRIINETAADIFGREIRDLVLARYYPELLTAIPDDAEAYVMAEQSFLALYDPIPAQAQSTFDLGAEMHETRVRVDRYMETVRILQNRAENLRLDGQDSTATVYDALAEDVILDAEAYMEERRVFFCDNGFCPRKINQAYFAFYGGYQAGDIPGIAGDDPIGTAVNDIYAMSPDIQSFIVTMRGITSRDELVATRDTIQAEISD